MNTLIVGSIGIDSIETPFAKAEGVLGGSASYAGLAASYFGEDGIVSVAGQDLTETHKKIFVDRKINIDGLSILPGKTFRWGGKYGFDLNSRETLFTELNTLAEFNPLLPETYKDCPYIFLGNMEPALQMKVLEQARAPKFIGLDTMNYWIEKYPNDLRDILPKINCLIINDAEARQLSGEYNIHKAAKKILKMMSRILENGNPQPTLIIKRGEYGLMMFQDEEVFFLPAFPIEEAFDPTGAGDSFAGAFVGYLSASDNLTWENLKRACVAGSVLASFCVEKMGTEKLQNLSTDEISQRTWQFKSLTDFDLNND